MRPCVKFVRFVLSDYCMRPKSLFLNKRTLRNDATALHPRQDWTLLTLTTQLRFHDKLIRKH
jgi:hypothetical protein